MDWILRITQNVLQQERSEILHENYCLKAECLVTKKAFESNVLVCCSDFFIVQDGTKSNQLSDLRISRINKIPTVREADSLPKFNIAY